MVPWESASRRSAQAELQGLAELEVEGDLPEVEGNPPKLEVGDVGGGTKGGTPQVVHFTTAVWNEGETWRSMSLWAVVDHHRQSLRASVLPTHLHIHR